MDAKTSSMKGDGMGKAARLCIGLLMIVLCGGCNGGGGTVDPDLGADSAPPSPDVTADVAGDAPAALDSTDSTPSVDAPVWDLATADATVPDVALDLGLPDAPASPDLTAADVGQPDIQLWDLATPDTAVTPDQGLDGPTADAASSAPKHAWTKSIGSTGYDVPGDVAVDSSGNVYTTGQFWGTVDFGGGPRTSHGDGDAYLVSYTGAGQHRWSKALGGVKGDNGRSVAVDGSDNVYVTGSFQDKVDFGGGVLSVNDIISPGYSDIFIASYDKNGNHRWSKAAGSDHGDGGGDVAVDKNGNVYVTGIIDGSMSFGGKSLGGNKNVFLVGYDTNGNHRWSDAFGGSYADTSGGVAVDTTGNVYLTGGFKSIINFGGGVLTANTAGSTYDDVFIASFTSTGQHRWSKSFGNSFSDVGSAVKADGSGNVYVTGRFITSVDFGGGVLSSAGNSSDIFLASYDTNGNHRWSKGFGSTSGDSSHGLAVDSSDNIYITGYFEGTVSFGGLPVSSVATGYDCFIASLDSNGQHIWSKAFAGPSIVGGYGLAVDGSGGVFATGMYFGTVDFGGGPITSKGSAEAFLFKLQP
jgi:hypothetical protein